ncbi:hypothetical protein NBRC116493_17970 [Aurantivibrio infirmus]
MAKALKAKPAEQDKINTLMKAEKYEANNDKRIISAPRIMIVERNKIKIYLARELPRILPQTIYFCRAELNKSIRHHGIIKRVRRLDNSFARKQYRDDKKIY